MPITCSSNYNYLHLSLNTMKIYRELYIGRNWKGNWLCLDGKIVLCKWLYWCILACLYKNKLMYKYSCLVYMYRNFV